MEISFNKFWASTSRTECQSRDSVVVFESAHLIVYSHDSLTQNLADLSVGVFLAERVVVMTHKSNHWQNVKKFVPAGRVQILKRE